MLNDNRKPCAGQDEIPDSDSLRAAALGLDVCDWTCGVKRLVSQTTLIASKHAATLIASYGRP